MIDLTRTEEQMLAEVRTGAAGEAQINLCGKTPDELLPTLMDTFSRHYESLPSERVYDELSYLVKKGLGNAYKWGNECAPDLALTVRAVMTDVGAVVAISDQGQGFDVANVLGRFLRNDRYSRHGGSGFFHFHESSSVINYADDGRTLLIRFLCNGSRGTTAAVDARAPRARRSVQTGLAQLDRGVQVKVKGRRAPDGRFVATKVALKTAEEQAGIDAVIEDVNKGDRWIRVLNSIIRVSAQVEIASPEQRHLEFDTLAVGQAIEVIGTYSNWRGLVPAKIQVRHDSASGFEEIQGRVEEVRVTDGTFRVLDVLVATDADTEFKDKRPVVEEYTR